MKIIYLDNLKVFLVALVVAHHVAQGYQLGPEEWLVADPDKTKWLTLLISPSATYFMGLFFFISGYFLPQSYAKTTPGALFKKKVLRLGVPAIATVLFILPPTYYLTSYGQNYAFIPFVEDWFFTKNHFSFAHTWFILQLLVYSSLYICIHKSCKMRLSHFTIVLYTIALFASTWLVSMKFPQGSWYFYHLVEPYRLAQYISLFVAGIIAYNNNWLQTMSRSLGYTWLVIGVICFAILVMLKITNTAFSSTGYTLWSSIMCTSWCVGLVTLFRDCFNRQSALFSYLAKNSYTVYLVHVLPVIAMQRLLVPYFLGGLEKFCIAFSASYILSYLLASILRSALNTCATATK